jgi:hypothetical protein
MLYNLGLSGEKWWSAEKNQISFYGKLVFVRDNFETNIGLVQVCIFFGVLFLILIIFGKGKVFDLDWNEDQIIITIDRGGSITNIQIKGCGKSELYKRISFCRMAM